MSKVVVYSSSWCGGCKVVKKFLEEYNIDFEEVDITTVEGGQKAKELGIKSIPQTYVTTGNCSSLVFVGSKPETLKQILGAISD